MRAVRELQALGYTVGERDGKLTLDYKGDAEPPEAVTRSLLEKLRERKSEALTYLCELAETQRIVRALPDGIRAGVNDEVCLERAVLVISRLIGDIEYYTQIEPLIGGVEHFKREFNRWLIPYRVLHVLADAENPEHVEALQTLSKKMNELYKRLRGYGVKFTPDELEQGFQME